jgi:predicted Zn-dependent protease
LAGVLAHEVQHVMHRHSVRAIIREAPIRIAISLMLDGGVEMVAGIAGTLSELSYRRADEAEADRDGMRLMQDARLDGRAMVSFMRTLARGNARAPRHVSYLSSHPHTESRVAELEGLVQQGAATTPLMDNATWSRVKVMCDAPPAGGM